MNEIEGLKPQSLLQTLIIVFDITSFLEPPKTSLTNDPQSSLPRKTPLNQNQGNNIQIQTRKFSSFSPSFICVISKKEKTKLKWKHFYVEKPKRKENVEKKISTLICRKFFVYLFCSRLVFLSLSAVLYFFASRQNYWSDIHGPEVNDSDCDLSWPFSYICGWCEFHLIFPNQTDFFFF